MFKKFLCCISACAVLISAVIPVSVFSANATELTAASGEYLLYGFDDVTDLSAQKWKPRWDNGGTALQMSLETGYANVYGGKGKSIKVVYDCAKKESVGPPTIWVGDSSFAPKGDGITFWIKSEKATKIKVVAADRNWNLLIFNTDIKAGENLIFIKYSDFSNYESADMSKLNQFQIRTDGNDANTFYFDNFGFFDLPESEKPTPPPEETAEKPAGMTEMLFSFDGENDLSSLKWKPRWDNDGAALQMSLETDISNVYGDNGNSLKVEYDRTKTANKLPCIWHEAKLTTKGEGFIFWLKSAEDTKFYLVALDKNSNGVKTNPIDIMQGENIIIVKYSDFFKFSGSKELNLSTLSQIQIRPDGANNTGTYWLDCFGFYSTPAVHENDFFEFQINGGKWKKNSTSKASYSWDNNAEHYHSGITDVKDNTAALKVKLSNLSTSNTNSLYYDAPIRVSEYEPYIYGEDSVLSFWIYSEQEVRLDILYSDKDKENNNIMSATKTLTVPAGESIFKLPMSELVKSGTEPIFKQVYQLQFRFYKSEGTVNTSSSTVWIDAIGFYDKNPDINTSPQLHSENTLIWWNFDGDKNVEEVQWRTRWAGTDGKGINISLDDDAANTYGRAGKSLKVEYKTAESENGQPSIWLGDKRIAMYGKGFTFWIKSEYQTKIRLVCIDADGQTALTDRISVKIGENIITVPYEQFKISGTDTPANMASAYQLQIRAGISDSNTFWIDSIGFYDIENDGSNAYYSINPPESYKNWYEGVSVVGEGFEDYPGDDDMKFCSEWYFDSNGWISLVNDAGNIRLKMDYDLSGNSSSILTNITSYKEVDTAGGISFWAKSSVERYYTLSVWLGNETTAVVVFKASPQGRYYKIPFSAFWLNNKININYSSAGGTVTVPKMTITSDSNCNPPATDTTDNFSLWLDDIKFVDSDSYKRAGAVDHYENGVRLKADEKAFSVGVYPKVEVLTVNNKQDYISKMSADGLIGVYKIDAFDINHVSAVPQKAVEIIFDIPDGTDPDKAVLYQSFMDGSLTKCNTTVTEDGKLKAQVYRLGTYVLGQGTGIGNTLDVETGDTQRELVNTFALLAVTSALFVLTAGYILIVKGRRENEE